MRKETVPRREELNIWSQVKEGKEQSRRKKNSQKGKRNIARKWYQGNKEGTVNYV